MSRIIGIDPGSRVTGYGVIDSIGGKATYVASGALRLGDGALAPRLCLIHQSLQQLIDEHRPDVMAVERVFMHRNADSALKLGHARGVALCVGALLGLEVVEYTPQQIKQAVVGGGRAAKDQVQYMVKLLLNLRGRLQVDAADALGVALCHAHASATVARIPGASRSVLGRLR